MLDAADCYGLCLLDIDGVLIGVYEDGFVVNIGVNIGPGPGSHHTLGEALGLAYPGHTQCCVWWGCVDETIARLLRMGK